MKNSNFCHLHLHGEFSRLDGMGKAKQWAEAASELGYTHLAITDHGNIDGTIKFQQACNEFGIKSIIGVEAYITEDRLIKNKSSKSAHILILVKNQQGWSNLVRLMTIANLEGFYKRPRIDFESLINHCEGLIISTACINSILHLNGGKELILEIYNRTGEVYLELMPHNTEEQVNHNRYCLDLNGEYGIPIVATNDCHYIHKEDKNSHEVLLAIQRGAKWNDTNRWKFHDEYEVYFKTADEMIDSFQLQGLLNNREIVLAMRETMNIAKKCENFRIEKREMTLPHVPGLENIDEEKYFHDLCVNVSNKLELSPFDFLADPKYEERFEYEFNVIKNKGFIRYFLIVYELVDWCKKNNIMIGPGRGSVGSSLIAYMLGITQVDPIEYNLPFSRFINEERIDFPDIDIDFEDRKRHLVIERLKQLYGTNHVCGISNFLRMKSRLIVRDVARVFDIPLKEVNEFTKLIKDSIDDATETGKGFIEKYPDVIKHARNLEGQVRGYGSHAAGLVVSLHDLRTTDQANLRDRNGELLVNWEKDDTEYMGLMKLDILGLKTLSVLNAAKDLIRENKGIEIIYEKIPLTDENIFKMISNGDTIGIFQMGYAIMSLIKQMGIESIHLWSDAIALGRPGPLDSGTAEDFIERKHGKQWEKKHPIYEEVTQKTFGLICYQEDVMNVVHKVAGLSYAVADNIRKIIGKKRDASEFEKFKSMFIDGCARMKTLSPEEASHFWEDLHNFSRYGFNRAHSMEYAIIGYWTAYLKYYYPAEFICATLTYDKKTSKSDILSEARKIGLEIIPPKVGISDSFRWIVKNNKLYVPFVEIKGIGEKTAEEICEKKEKKKSIGFFTKEENDFHIKGKSREILEKIKAFDMDISLPKDALDLFDFDVSCDINDGYPNLISVFGRISQDKIDHYLYGNIDGAKLVKQQNMFTINENLLKCKQCELYKECTQPVPPSVSDHNIMIVGEAPGKDEDIQGSPFVGKASEVLWKELKKYDLERNIFHVTNTCKCWPSSTKNPNKEHIEACRNWLEEEIKNVKPILVLALGAKSMYFFTGEESGITKKSEEGTTRWIEKHGCYVCFCLHPSSVLRNGNNRIPFEKGIRNFSEKLERIGGI